MSEIHPEDIRNRPDDLEESEDTPTGTRVVDADSPSPESEAMEQLLQHTIDVPVLAELVERQEAADAADTLERLEDDEAADILEQMEDRRAAEALAEMQMPLAVNVLEEEAEEDPKYAARLLELMAPDDAADLLQAIDADHRQQILRRMSARPRRDLIALAAYDEESAGGMMTSDVLALTEDMTVNDATSHIRALELERAMNDALVTDDETRLVGIISLRDLLIARPHERIGDLMERNIKAVSPELDREHVAHEFDRYDHEMLPVVDDVGHLLGVVTVDDVIDIIRAEQTEDVQMTVGAGKGEAVYSPMREKLRGRLPWLAISLIIMCAAAIVVLFNEGLIRETPVLAFLLPVIAAVVGNAGHQALAVTMRGIVLNEVRRERIWPLIIREALVGLINGAALGLMIFGLVMLLAGAPWQVGLAAGAATMFAMTIGTLCGCSVPLVMRRIGVDPAQASAIILIGITDALSFTALLSMATLLAGEAT